MDIAIILLVLCDIILTVSKILEDKKRYDNLLDNLGGIRKALEGVKKQSSDRVTNEVSTAVVKMITAEEKRDQRNKEFNNRLEELINVKV